MSLRQRKKNSRNAAGEMENMTNRIIEKNTGKD